MQKLPVGWLLSFIQDGRGFLLGLLAGAMLASAGTTIAEDHDRQDSFRVGVYYAVTELAVDTEMNATNIAALRVRLSDLELKVAEIAKDKN